ncbi:hypothetical protein GXB85_14150 [Cellulomonas sp. APG4]|uniref:FUSC family protein n=1 Tax=Cellulomonas sp. APG4 TaxID=1538656 RepID=UPI00137B4FAF|nr:aromatic acid exporter family protein [Cellulomonas sp. APG4]NCT92086.1 hypothetical protein [Cellulomonas sp. APG4]
MPRRPRLDAVMHRVRRALLHPRMGLALRTGLAAALAWFVASRLPGAAHEYAFYAPLGAVVATYPTVTSTVRESLQGVAAISLGAVIALVGDRLIGPSIGMIAIVVTLGVLLGGLPWLGGMRTYVPTAALFVLVIGQGDEVAYSLSYAGLFLLGAAIAMVANLVFPALHLRPVDDATRDLREALHAHLEHLSCVVAGEHGLDHDGAPGRSGLTALTSRARAAAFEARESRRANLRARRSPDAVDSRYEAFRALERVVLMVDDLYDLVQEQPWGTDLRTTSAELRAPMARALKELADVVLVVGTEDAVPGRNAGADAAVVDLAETLREHQAAGGEDAEALVAGTVVTALRRCVAAVTAEDELSDAPESRILVHPADTQDDGARHPTEQAPDDDAPGRPAAGDDEARPPRGPGSGTGG